MEKNSIYQKFYIPSLLASFISSVGLYLQPLQEDSESTDVVFSNLPQKFTRRLP